MTYTNPEQIRCRINEISRIINAATNYENREIAIKRIIRYRECKKLERDAAK